MQIKLPIFKEISKKKKEGFIKDLSDELIKVELMISNIENSVTKIDIEEEKSELEILKQEIENNTFTAEKMDTSLINIYQTMTDKLMNIKSRLDKYESLILLMNKASYLESSIKSSEAEKDLQKYTALCLELLNDIDNMNISIISKNKNIYEKVYQIIYDFIKLEIINTLKSEVLESIKKQNVGIYYINNLIRNDIERTKKGTFINNTKLLDRLNMLTSKNTSSTLASDVVNIDVIITLLLIEKDDKMLNTLKANMNNITSDYSKNLEKLETYLAFDGKINETKSELEELKDKLRNTNKTLKKKAISLLISTSLIIGIAVNLPSIGKGFNTKYVTTTDIYETGKEPISLTSYESRQNEITRTLKLYNKSEKSWSEIKRNYQTCDVTDIIMKSGNPEDYLNIDVESFDFSLSRVDTEIIDEECEEGRILTVVTQNHDSDYVFDEENYRIFLICAYIILVLGVVFFEISPIHYIVECVKLMEESDHETNKINEINKKQEELIQECKRYIKSNKDLENKYYELYNGEIKYLTNKELEDKIKSLLEINDTYKKELKQM